MSCIKCYEAQGHNEDAEGEITNMMYIRVGRANLLVSGCDEHLKQLLDERRTNTQPSNTEGDKE